MNERNAWIKFYREMRDDFAQAALQGLLANNPVGEAESFAAAAYRLADAMLAERAKLTKP